VATRQYGAQLINVQAPRSQIKEIMGKTFRGIILAASGAKPQWPFWPDIAESP
jgi:hypothetical protein